jgi:hypothetical protein
MDPLEFLDPMVTLLNSLKVVNPVKTGVRDFFRVTDKSGFQLSLE